MTLFQQTASAPTIGRTERAFSPQLLAIMAGLIVVLMAAAVTSYVAGRPADAAIQSNAETAATDGWLPAALAANRQHRIDAANALTDGWQAAFTPLQTTNAPGGEEAVIQRFLLGEAAADGEGLRFPMQTQQVPADGYERSVRAD